MATPTTMASTFALPVDPRRTVTCLLFNEVQNMEALRQLAFSNALPLTLVQPSNIVDLLQVCPRDSSPTRSSASPEGLLPLFPTLATDDRQAYLHGHSFVGPRTEGSVCCEPCCPPANYWDDEDTEPTNGDSIPPLPNLAHHGRAQTVRRADSRHECPHFAR